MRRKAADGARAHAEHHIAWLDKVIKKTGKLVKLRCEDGLDAT